VNGTKKLVKPTAQGSIPRGRGGDVAAGVRKRVIPGEWQASNPESQIHSPWVTAMKKGETQQHRRGRERECHRAPRYRWGMGCFRVPGRPELESPGNFTRPAEGKKELGQRR